MKNPGLILTLGNAPRSAHVVCDESGEPLIGLYRPDVPTPVDSPGSLSLRNAQLVDENMSIPLKLVSVDDPKAASDRAKKDKDAGRKAAVSFRKAADGAEVDQVRDELLASKGN